MSTYFRGNKTIKDILLSSKAPYNAKVVQYTGIGVTGLTAIKNTLQNTESARTFGERYKEHLKTPTPIHSHHTTTGHQTSTDNLIIVGREGMA